MALHGRATLELMREGKVVHRITHNNTVTAMPQNLMREGNFNLLATKDKFMPLAEKLFGGVYLTDITNGTNGLPVSMIDHSANITAQASNDAYTGTNLKRGIIDTTRTYPLSNGYQFCWFWDQNRGNGTINSICLTMPELAKIELRSTQSALSNEAAYANDYLADNVEIDTSLSDLNIIDYENEYGYKVWQDNGSIKLEKWSLNTKRYHLNGSALEAIAKIDEYTVTPPSGVEDYDSTRCSISYTGSKIHFITFEVTGSNTTVHDYQIATSDYSLTVLDRTYQGVAFDSFYEPFKDGIPVDETNHRIYAICDSNANIAICDLNDATNVTTVANPLSGIADASDYNGACLWLPNGDFYKVPYPAWGAGDNPVTVLYYHNAKFYATKMLYKELYGSHINGLNGNNYCSVLAKSPLMAAGYNRLHLETFAPYVTTVNDLSTAVNKTGSLTMRLTYRLTEA